MGLGQSGENVRVPGPPPYPHLFRLGAGGSGCYAAWTMNYGNAVSKVCRLAVLAALCVAGLACSKASVSLENRPCAEGDRSEACVPGYQCHPLTQICVPAVAVYCDEPGGICPENVITGDACPSSGSFMPCSTFYDDCTAGCRTCRADGTWSACEGATECPNPIGRVNNCATCNDDCTTRVQGATPECTYLGGEDFACDYLGGCDAGHADADGNRQNGCECTLNCDGLCGGDDGCGGTCPDICTATEACNPETFACACVPQCDGRCAGEDGCGGFCLDNCAANEVCNGSTGFCDCVPECAGRCAGDDGCGGVCPDSCSGQEVCNTGTEVCECIPACDAQPCGVADGCGGQCGCSSCGFGGVAEVCAPDDACPFAVHAVLTVTAKGEDLPTGYSVAFAFDHAGDVAAGRSVASGDDVQIYYYDDLTGWRRIHRVADPEPAFHWNQSPTTIWFALQEPLAANTSTSDYVMVRGSSSPGAVLDDGNEVFVMADFFDGTTIDSRWVLENGTLSQVSASGGWLRFGAHPANYTPSLKRNFAKTYRMLTVRARVRWEQVGTDLEYGTSLSLGDWSLWVNPPPSADWTGSVDGVGAFLLRWRRTETDVNPAEVQSWFWSYGFPASGDPPAWFRFAGPVDDSVAHTTWLVSDADEGPFWAGVLDAGEIYANQLGSPGTVDGYSALRIAAHWGSTPTTQFQGWDYVIVRYSDGTLNGLNEPTVSLSSSYGPVGCETSP